MKLLMAIALVLAASAALASPAACVPGTEIVSGIFADGAVLNSPLACTEDGVTFENFSVTVISDPGLNSLPWTLSIGPSTGSTSYSGSLEFAFTELGPGDEFVLTYDMSLGIGPPSEEELTLEAGPLTEVTEHICAESCVTLYAQDDEGSSTAVLPPASEDSVLLDVIDGNRMSQLVVFTPEPGSFALAGYGVLGVGLVGLIRRRIRKCQGATRRKKQGFPEPRGDPQSARSATTGSIRIA
jgi:hypothetical protein